jgi:hypothetical protein
LSLWPKLPQRKIGATSSKIQSYKINADIHCILSQQSAMAPLFVLTETSAGYALLKSTDKKLLKRSDLADKLQTAEDVCNM